MKLLNSINCPSPLACLLALVFGFVERASRVVDRLEDWLFPLPRSRRNLCARVASTPTPAESIAYESAIECEFCATPATCLDADVVLIGSAITLASVRYLIEQARANLGRPLRVAVLEAGPLDLLTHLSNTGFPRGEIIRAGTERVGGKLALWGVSTPRPPNLMDWPYPFDELCQRFAAVERLLGVPDPIPASGLKLEAALLAKLRVTFPDFSTTVAPLAIDQLGHRWSPLREIPHLTPQGVAIVSRFRCTHLVIEGGKVASISGQWIDGSTWTFNPRVVVLGVGVTQSLSLLRQAHGRSLPLETADHIRIDLHGMLLPGAFGNFAAGELGVGVLLMACRSKTGVPFHLEIKVAPVSHWREGRLPSADNLQNVDAEDEAIWCQIQAIGAMHDRFPLVDLLNVKDPVPPVMSSRDASLHGEIVETMQQAANAIGLSAPIFAFRPLTTNHHLYGALRVGKGVTKEFRFQGVDNLFVLPPTAFVDCDDDANPTLKSLVLAQYAMDAIVRDFSRQEQSN